MKRIHMGLFKEYAALLATLGIAWSPHLARAGDVIEVGTVEELQAAVLIPGATVKVAPGTYALTQNLLLAEGTRLIGSNRMRDTDRDGIPDPIEPPDGFVVAGTETKLVGNPAAAGNIIGGSGSNRVAQLTVEAPPLGTRVLVSGVKEVTDCLLACTRGTFAANDLGTFVGNSQCSGCEAEAVLRRNVIRNCLVGASYANNRTTDARIGILMRGNRFYANTTGFNPVGGQAADTSEINVVSILNLMENNAQGWAAIGGTGIHHVVPGVLTGSHDNRARIYSFGDSFRDNLFFGIFGLGSFRRAVAGVFSEEHTDNQLQIDLFKASLEQSPSGADQGDVVLLGGFSSPSAASPSPGSNNVVKALILGSEVEPDPTPDLVLFDSSPPLGTGNEVVLIGSEKAFTLLNDPFDLETYGVDFCEFFTAGCPE